MLTEDHSMDPVASFLLFLKDVIGLATLTEIAIDASPTEHAAITRVYSEATVQWCFFHPDAQVNDYGFEGHDVRKRSRNFSSEDGELQYEYSQHAAFLIYMERTYLNREKFVHWSAAFQPQVFTNMETNNYIESWHN
ncbi:hypothetical protein EDC96DRAFT_571030 [Choanephora cucurbitarum]|nr:hypothetical protein EDC96DRAFT_571030 [Choanephora cucurbitarum]